jgi:phage terminase Nu1 subunit (DNA packaging protein)
MWELKRAIESGYRELTSDIAQLNQQLSMYVLREVYDAHRLADEQRRTADLERRAADLDRVARLEAQVVDQREQTRRAMWTAISSFLAPIAVAVVLAFMLRGGG